MARSVNMIPIQHIYSPRSSNTLQHMSKKQESISTITFGQITCCHPLASINLMFNGSCTVAVKMSMGINGSTNVHQLCDCAPPG
uniref:UL143 n=1 Tax=Human cytomegalovirus TaxID=10359 RepID=Q5S219_HCMV|nr:UL143 [Human betaherpesvirus 5]AAV65614.1 UL143 [Human betaherpesvirus 5]